MASFTDITPTFNPYVQQLPVDALISIGMEKQRRYEEGVQRIQSSIDRVAGLDIMKPGDKQYLQGKINNMATVLRANAAGDFSNYQLVNSLSGMVGSIAKDTKIQTAVNSTAKVRKEIELMETDRKEGKLNPANEYVLSKEISNWLDDGQIGSDFSGRYEPEFDIFKFAKETFDAVKPDNFSYDEIFELGADGKPIMVKSVDRNGKVVESPVLSHYMTRIEKEGRSLEKVKQTIQQIFSDPRVSRQLAISGQYVYRNHDKADLQDLLIDQKGELLNAYDEEMNSLNLRKLAGEDVDKQIDQLKSNKTKTSLQYDNYITDLVNSNPDAIRGFLYSDDVSNRYTRMFTYENTKRQIMDSPPFKMEFELQKEANEQSRFAQRLAFDKQKEAADQRRWEFTYEQKEREIQGKLAPQYPTFEQGPEPTAIDVIRQQSQDYEKAAADYALTGDQFIWESVLGKNPNNTNLLGKLVGAGMTKEAAINKIISDTAASRGESVDSFRTRWIQKAATTYENMTPDQQNASPAVRDAYRMYRANKKIFDGAKTVNDAVTAGMAAQMGDLAKEYSLQDIKPTNIEYKGKNYTITKEDAFDLALLLHAESYGIVSNQADAKRDKNMGEMAASRLRQRGKGDLINAMYTDLDITSGVGTLRQPVKEWLFGTKPSQGFKLVDKWKGVNSAFRMISDKKYGEGLNLKADLIRRAYGKYPTLTMGLVTGDSKTDDRTFATIKRITGQYGDMNANLSPDFKEFMGGLGETLEKSNIGVTSYMDGNGNPRVELVAYSGPGKGAERIGGMTLEADQAAALGINVNSLYEPREVVAIRNKINYNSYGTKTCAGDPSKTDTYLQGDAYFVKEDFPYVSGSKAIDIKANIELTNGNMYYPYLYISIPGEKPKVKPLDGSTNLQQVVNTLMTMDEKWAKQLFSGK